MDIQLKNINYKYNEGTPLEYQALHDITCNFPKGSFTAIVGHTGSGKSTLTKLLNGLLIPSSGNLRMGNRTITPHTSERDLKLLRKKIGTVMQFPEMQLFGQTVAEDIVFGPMNYGSSYNDALEIAAEKLNTVGLDSSYLEQSPFDLSGGQQRRVAIAGVLALEPEVLILDEPTIGLDPHGQQTILTLFKEMNQTLDTTIILITHQMEDVVKYADNVLVLNEGKILTQGTPQEVFEQDHLLQKAGLDVPVIVSLAREMEAKYNFKFTSLPLSIEALTEQMAHYLLEVADEQNN